MGSFFYSLTVEAIRKQIASTFGSGVEPLQAPQGSIVQHLLWMCKQLEELPKTPNNALKAGRWIGWMLHACEMLGLWDNAASRQFVRLDVDGRHDQADHGTLYYAIAETLRDSSLATVAGGKKRKPEDLEAMLASVANAILAKVVE